MPWKFRIETVFGALALFLVTINSSSLSSTSSSRRNQCHCMEFWNCSLSGGEIYSYCGHAASEVCCLLTNSIQHDNNSSGSPLRPGSSRPGSRTPKPTQLSKLLRSSPSPSTGESLEFVKFGTCGRSLNNGNVDSMAKFKEWPWHVAILEAKGDLYICGGSFLENENGDQLILTAGHCVSNYANSMQRLKVRLGEFDVSTNSEPVPHVEVLVRNIVLHPQFTSNGYLQNDIAILQLNNSIDLGNRDNIHPICLPESEPDTDTDTAVETDLTSLKCVVSGWGRKHEQSLHSVILKEIDVPIWQHGVCEQKLRRTFGPNYTLSENVLCAGKDGKDACDGDGGGPLVCFERSTRTWTQQGIVSWGVGCARTNPGIYTKVSAYLSWIKSLF